MGPTGSDSDWCGDERAYIWLAAIRKGKMEMTGGGSDADSGLRAWGSADVYCGSAILALPGSMTTWVGA
jgi:hypothetical protein